MGVINICNSYNKYLTYFILSYYIVGDVIVFYYIKIMRICTSCLIKKDFLEFYKYKMWKNWFRSICIKCSNKKRKKYKKTKKWLITSMYIWQLRRNKIRNHWLLNYTKQELKEWIFKQDNFEELYNNRTKSWYKTDLIPSVDRLDDYKWYSFDNIQLITWKENNAKWHADKKNWINNKQNKSVIWIHKITWKIIDFYSSMEAERQTWIYHWSILKCCKWKLKTAWWYNWRYKNITEIKNWRKPLY